MSITPSTRSSSPEPIEPSPLHLKVYYSTKPGRFPPLENLPHPTSSYISLSLLPTTTLHTITHLLVPQLPPALLTLPTPSPHPSDLIGTRLSCILVYAVPTTNAHSPPKYEVKPLGVLATGADADKVSEQRLDECGFVTGDWLCVAVVREGEVVPQTPVVGGERRGYERRRGGGDGETWARGGGFSGRGAGRFRGGGGERDERGWSRGEEVLGGERGERRDGRDRGYGGRGRGGGIGWGRGGRGGSGGGDRW